MKLFECKIEIDLEAQERLLEDARKAVAIDILRMMRRRYGNDGLFRDDTIVREICLIYDIELYKYRMAI